MLVNIENTIHTASRGKLKLNVGGYSSAGVKEINEDAIAINSPQKPSRSTKGVVAVIADGVSHAKQAAKASQYCVEEFSRAYYDSPKTWSTQKIISEVLSKINTHLFQKKKDPDDLTSNNKPQWLTTFSGIVFKSATVHIFHVGDTQVARIRDGKLHVLTTPHNQRLANNNCVLTRALGADNHLKVDYQQLDLQINDVYILTTDGIHEHVDSASLVEQYEIIDDLGLLSSQYAQLALTNNSEDNLSCLIVKTLSVPDLQPDEIRKTLLQRVVPPVLADGQILEGYKVLRTIHASSRSHLYAVEDVSSGKQFTLKAPSDNFSEDEIYLQGFIREAWVGSQIDHPAIMKVYPVKADAKFLYHICEYIHGQTLRQWMIDHPNPRIDEVRQIITQASTALRVLKKLEIVHRDIKPENLMIDQDGQVKLIDYGTVSVAALEEQINRFTETHPLGTVNYVAPETIINMTSSAQSDLFSLGVVAYEMLTGKLPYPKLSNHRHHKSLTDWQYQNAMDFRHDIPLWLELALRKSVEPDPKQRYDLYSEFIADITKPNLSVEHEFNSRPFIERDPVKFWKLVSACLALCIIFLLST